MSKHKIAIQNNLFNDNRKSALSTSGGENWKSNALLGITISVQVAKMPSGLDNLQFVR